MVICRGTDDDSVVTGTDDDSVVTGTDDDSVVEVHSIRADRAFVTVR